MRGICLVGTGVIATQHMKALEKIGGLRHSWVIGRTYEQAFEFARVWDFCQPGVNLEDSLSDPQVSLVIIASPSALHADQAMQAVRAGKDVIVEIPVGVNLAEVQMVASVAEARGVRVFVCHTMRSFPGIREVRRRVQAGEFEITQICGHFAIPRRRNQTQAGQRSWIDNLLWHHACHQVDATMWVLGVDQVERVSAMFGQTHPKFGMSMELSLHFATPARQLVTQTLTYNAEQLVWELRFIGSNDVLIFRNGCLSDEQGASLMAAVSWVDLIAQDRQMLAALENKHPCEYDVQQVLPAMRVLHLAQISTESN